MLGRFLRRDDGILSAAALAENGVILHVDNGNLPVHLLNRIEAASDPSAVVFVGKRAEIMLVPHDLPHGPGHELLPRPMIDGLPQSNARSFTILSDEDHPSRFKG